MQSRSQNVHTLQFIHKKDDATGQESGVMLTASPTRFCGYLLGLHGVGCDCWILRHWKQMKSIHPDPEQKSTDDVM